ncbi:MAG: undecaprenyl-diphosphate phosphatase [Rariglobus sp.]|nr:undecaprenyl-diphosphate phosphatase [Rariglobus sp.]
MRCLLATILACAALSLPARSQTTEPVAELSTRDAVILGLVEGITEFLPISSTGHLIIANHALELESDTPLLDSEGNTLWHKPPSAKYPDGIPLTVKLAADTYVVVIQAGAIAAVVLIFWGRLTGILSGLMGRNSSGLRLFRNIIVACIPAVVLGFSVGDLIDRYLFSIEAVIVALVSGAVLMFAAERWRKQQPGTATSRLDPSDLTIKQSLGIGFMQCLALWPGTSRSMVTMVGGYFAGLSPARSAEFSFLVGLPILCGAALLKSYKAGPAMISVFGVPSVLLGSLVAALSAALAVKFLVSYLSRNGLGVFAVYRIALATVLAAWFLV